MMIMRKDYDGPPFTLYIIPRLILEERSLPFRDNDCKEVGENIAFFCSVSRMSKDGRKR